MPSAAMKPDFGSQQAAMQTYLATGERRALALDNRGPIRLNNDGSLDQSILDAYWKYGFYVFTGVIGKAELRDIEADVNEMQSRKPVEKNARFDAQGRPASQVSAGPARAADPRWSRG